MAETTDRLEGEHAEPVDLAQLAKTVPISAEVRQRRGGRPAIWVALVAKLLTVPRGHGLEFPIGKRTLRTVHMGLWHAVNRCGQPVSYHLRSHKGRDGVVRVTVWLEPKEVKVK